MYKKVYVEITNNCNLSCLFCIKTDRKKKYLSTKEYLTILDKIKDYTSYIYLHVMGEPTLHPLINEFIDIAKGKGFNINITTNGYLISRIINNHNIRQINISLHSYDERYNKSLESYLGDIFKTINNLCSDTYFSLRLWVNSKYSKDILDYINNYYNISVDSNIIGNIKLAKNVFLSFEKEFVWPSLDNNYYNEVGTCYALRDHIGILCDGTIVPCCLDSNGILKLGNIYNDELIKVINSEKYQKMLNGFKNNKKCEELCKKCNFID